MFLFDCELTGLGKDPGGLGAMLHEIPRDLRAKCSRNFSAIPVHSCHFLFQWTLGYICSVNICFRTVMSSTKQTCSSCQRINSPIELTTCDKSSNNAALVAGGTEPALEDCCILSFFPLESLLSKIELSLPQEFRSRSSTAILTLPILKSASPISEK